MREEWYDDNNFYWADLIDFEIRFRQHQEERHRLFVGRHNVEVLIVVPVIRATVFVSALDRWSRYEPTRLLYVSTPQVFSYCTGVYRNCLDGNGHEEMISRAEKELMSMDCFFTACCNGSPSHSFGYPQCDHHRGGILEPLRTGALEDLDVFGLYSLFVSLSTIQCYACWS